MVAYNLIGYLMEGLARKEGLDLDWGDISYLRGDKSSKENQGSELVFSFHFFFFFSNMHALLATEIIPERI
jgi:hypothetical protein